MGEVTSLIDRLNAKDKGAVDQLFAVMYADLRRIARSRLAASGRHTLLDTSLLVHETYMRFLNVGELKINDRDHFFAYAASTVRSIVVDFVRKRSAGQRGGDVDHVTLNTEVAQSIGADDDEILLVHEALDTLAQVDERLVKIVEMRYFGGLTEVEIGSALGISDRTVRRDWERARLLLLDIIQR